MASELRGARDSGSSECDESEVGVEDRNADGLAIIADHKSPAYVGRWVRLKEVIVRVRE